MKTKLWAAAITELAGKRKSLNTRMKAVVSRLGAAALKEEKPDDHLELYDALVKECATIAQEEREHDGVQEKPEPVAVSFRMGNRMEHQEYKETSANGVVTASGSAFLGSLGTVLAIAQGVEIFNAVLCPSMLPDARLKSLSDLYDMYSLDELVFEFISECSTSTAGGFAAWADSDVMADTLFGITGGAFVSAAMSSPENTEWSAYTSAAVGVVLPQQSVYFTTNTDNPNLMCAGVLHLGTIAALIANLTCALVKVHFKVRFSNATGDRLLLGGGFIVGFSGVVSTFTGVVLTVGNTYANPIANVVGMIVSPGVVYCGTVVAHTDPGTGATWRSVTYGEGQQTTIIGDGAGQSRRIWFRASGNNTTVVYYASFGAALIGENVNGQANADCIQCGITVTPAATANFTLDDVQGFSVNPSV